MSFDPANFKNFITTVNVSIPFDQGNVFRQNGWTVSTLTTCLNPFRSGQCLSTGTTNYTGTGKIVSIPFDQGNVFRQRRLDKDHQELKVSIPFDQGNVFRPITH